MKNWKWFLWAAVAILAVWAILAMMPKVEASTHTIWSAWEDTSSCVATVCDSTVGTKTQKSVCIAGGSSHTCTLGTPASTSYDYADPICPADYHVQNSGNWNQRCHRDHFWQSPEHKAPIGCPTGFVQHDAVCQKTVVNPGTPADEQTQTIACNDAPIVQCPCVDENQNGICDKDEVVTPPDDDTTPVVEAPCSGKCGDPPTFAGSSTEAPKCSNGNTTQLPANLHVVREGGDATVNFFITEGDSANIYWRVVGSSEWQNAVADVKPNGDKFVGYTIHGLNPALGYDFGIQQVRGCSGGQLVTAVVVDGPESQTFGMSYWTW
jgi:hypothetical protein